MILYQSSKDCLVPTPADKRLNVDIAERANRPHLGSRIPILYERENF